MDEIYARKAVACSEIVSRLLTASRHIRNDGSASVEAFLLRSSENALSVFRLAKLSPDECANQLRAVKGQATLHAGHIRATTVNGDNAHLNVVINEEASHVMGHAEISGLPHQALNKEDAERLAGLLSRQSRRLR